MSTPADPVAELTFEVERFDWIGDDRLEVRGRWYGIRGQRFLRPGLNVRLGDRRRRLIALLDHKPWAPENDGPWIAAFAWRGAHHGITAARLEVAPDIVVDLPIPGRAAAGTTTTARARPRRAPSPRKPRPTPPPADPAAVPDAAAPAERDLAMLALERRLVEERAARERVEEELADARRQLEGLAAHHASAVERSREVVRLEGELAAAIARAEAAEWAPIEIMPPARTAPRRGDSQERGTGTRVVAVAVSVVLLVVFTLILTSLL